MCLPYRHDGGALRIAHCGQKTIYAWGNQDGIIQWAAFYSDCEHAVYKVTAGHRITLTYNLYAHEQLGGGFRSPSTIDMDSFTLYRNVKDALASPDFLPKGLFSHLGFHFSRSPLFFFQEAPWAFIAYMPTLMRMTVSWATLPYAASIFR